MKKSDIEKQLKKDLSVSVPSDFNAVWNKCTTPEADCKELVAEPVPVTAGNRHTATMQGKGRKIVPLVTLIVAALLCISVLLCIYLPGKLNGFILPDSSGFFVIDVNPSIKVNYDNYGVVTLAQGLNSDGEELLNGLELNGLTYDKAADRIFDRCLERGYIVEERDDNAFLMTASKDNGEKDEKITAELNKCFSQKFEDKKMKGVVISDVDNSKWQKEADKYGINGQKYELIMRYLDMGGKLDESEYESITIRELYSLILNLNKNK